MVEGTFYKWSTEPENLRLFFPGKYEVSPANWIRKKQTTTKQKTSQWHTSHHHSAEKESQRKALSDTATNSPQRASWQLLSSAHKKWTSKILKPFIQIHSLEANYGKIGLLQNNGSILLPLQNATTSQDLENFISPSHQKRYFLTKQKNPQRHKWPLLCFCFWKQHLRVCGRCVSAKGPRAGRERHNTSFLSHVLSAGARLPQGCWPRVNGQKIVSLCPSSALLPPATSIFVPDLRFVFTDYGAFLRGR